MLHSHEIKTHLASTVSLALSVIFLFVSHYWLLRSSWLNGLTESTHGWVLNLVARHGKAIPTVSTPSPGRTTINKQNKTWETWTGTGPQSDPLPICLRIYQPCNTDQPGRENRNLVGPPYMNKERTRLPISTPHASQPVPLVSIGHGTPVKGTTQPLSWINPGHDSGMRPSLHWLLQHWGPLLICAQKMIRYRRGGARRTRNNHRPGEICFQLTWRLHLTGPRSYITGPQQRDSRSTRTLRLQLHSSRQRGTSNNQPLCTKRQTHTGRLGNVTPSHGQRRSVAWTFDSREGAGLKGGGREAWATTSAAYPNWRTHPEDDE